MSLVFILLTRNTSGFVNFVFLYQNRAFFFMLGILHRFLIEILSFNAENYWGKSRKKQSERQRSKRASRAAVENEVEGK